MFIQTEETPNPLAMKFIPGKEVMKEGTLTVSSKEDAWKSPLVELLFGITGVSEVFLSSDFISVTKTEDYDWALLKPQVLGNIMEYFMENDDVIVRQDPNEGTGQDFEFDESSLDDETKEIIYEIKELIETRIRPALLRMVGILRLSDLSMGLSILKCTERVQGVQARRSRLKTVWKICCATMYQK